VLALALSAVACTSDGPPVISAEVSLVQKMPFHGPGGPGTEPMSITFSWTVVVTARDSSDCVVRRIGTRLSEPVSGEAVEAESLPARTLPDGQAVEIPQQESGFFPSVLYTRPWSGVTDVEVGCPGEPSRGLQVQFAVPWLEGGREGAMRWSSGYRGVVVGCALWAAYPAFAEEDAATPIKKAREEAQANADSPEGREWKRSHSVAMDRLMLLVLNRCLPDPPGDIPTAFPVFVRLSKEGEAREMLTELDASLGTCMTKAGRGLPFPEAPRDDYWIQVNMAAPL